MSDPTQQAYLCTQASGARIFCKCISIITGGRSTTSCTWSANPQIQDNVYNPYANNSGVTLPNSQSERQVSGRVDSILEIVMAQKQVVVTPKIEYMHFHGVPRNSLLSFTILKHALVRTTTVKNQSCNC